MKKVVMAVVLVVGFILILPAKAIAADRYVDDCTPSEGGTGTSEDPFCSIKVGVSAASSGDTIKVASGTYNESDIEVNNQLTIIGENKNTTVIDAGYEASIFDVSGDSVKISGFTFKDFNLAGVNFLMGSGSEATISENEFIPGAAEQSVFASGGTSNVHILNNYMERAGIVTRSTCGSWNIVGNFINLQGEARNGIEAESPSYVIDNNEIFNAGDRTLENEMNKQAIFGKQGANTWSIINNDIYDNERGIYLSGIDHDVYKNNIYNNYSYGLFGSSSVDATHNWWGDIDGPSGAGPSDVGDAVNSSVIYKEWLCEEAPTDWYSEDGACQTLNPSVELYKVNGGAEKVNRSGTYFSLTVNTKNHKGEYKGKINYSADDLAVYAKTECVRATSDGTVAVLIGPIAKVQKGIMPEGDWIYTAIKEGGTGSGDQVNVEFLSETDALNKCEDSGIETNFPAIVEEGEFKIRL